MEAVLEPIAASTIGRGRDYKPSEDDPNFRNGSEQWGRTYDYQVSNNGGGRNLRSVWMFPTKPGKFNHYAAYPPRLPELAIKSSTSEKGCCEKCGAPWVRVVERGFAAHDGDTKTAYPAGTTASCLALLGQASCEQGTEYTNTTRTSGWRPSCTCDAGSPISCRVLDPFSGTGTTALVAEQLGQDSVSIDTSEEYIQLSKDRLADDERRRIDEFIKKAKRSARSGARA